MTTIKAYPKGWSEQQIRDYMTKERILSSLAGRNGDIYIRLEYRDKLTISKDDWDNIDVTINHFSCIT